MRSLINSFRYAGRGIIYCVNNERNMRIHLVVVAYMVYFMRFFTLTKGEKAIIVLMMAVVVFAEIVNTSIETIVNLLSPSYNQMARIAKDAAAGAVFVSAAAAVIVGILILWQPEAFERIWNYYSEKTMSLILLLVSLYLSFAFVFYYRDRSQKK